MIGNLLGDEEINAALVLVLSGAVTVLVANGPGPVSLGRLVSGALSNPVPGGAAVIYPSSPVSPRQRVAA